MGIKQERRRMKRKKTKETRWRNQRKWNNIDKEKTRKRTHKRFTTSKTIRDEERENKDELNEQYEENNEKRKNM